MAGRADPPELADPERRLALAYVPASRRPAVAALWALDEALARIVATTREPALGQMRLVWWRDALERLDTAPAPGEPVLQALAAEVLPAGVRGVELAPMTEGWDALLPPDDPDIESHAQDRGERLFALTGRLLGGTPPAGAGATWAKADAVKFLPELVSGRGAAAAGGGGGAGRGSAPLHHSPRERSPSPSKLGEEAKWPKPLRPLGMLYKLALRDPAERPGSPARILAMLRHRLTGR